jgi:phosphoribosylaminoimidazole carboxylase/phosphoribosylaminoimidazole-succinocarboxamide synthase
VKRKPGIARGSMLAPRMVEFFLKDDENHDPLIEPDEIVRRGLATLQEIGAMSEIARIVFEILAHAWRRRETLLVDLKIEFGRLIGGDGRGNLVIADVIDNDSWRIWPQGREDLMLDKQVFRNLAEVTQADLDRVKDNYERVAELVGTFPQMRPGMVALLADGADEVANIEPIARELSQFGLPSIRRVVSAHLVPGYALQVVQQLDTQFPRLLYVAVGAAHSGLPGLLDAATSTPVVRAASFAPHEVALSCAKALALDDTVMFGRVLLVQANRRSAILQADAQLNAPAPAPPGTVLA